MLSSGYGTVVVPMNSLKSMATCPKPGQYWVRQYSTMDEGGAQRSSLSKEAVGS